MSSEHFKIAKEINSLVLNKHTLQDEIASEEKRITFIQSNRASRQQELDKLIEDVTSAKTSMQLVENDIATNQLILDKDRIHMSSVTSNEQLKSLETSIKHVEENLEDLENKGLELLEEIELNEAEIADCESFLKGSSETLEEITEEVNQFKNSHQKQIDVLEIRIQNLTSELPTLFRDKIIRTLEKNINISSFTRIQNGSCEFCKYTLSALDISNIEDKLLLKSCQSCDRLFIPQQASY